MKGELSVAHRAAPDAPRDHWLDGADGADGTPTRFRNPWPSAGLRMSYREKLFTKLVLNPMARLSGYVALPKNREGLVRVQRPDWGAGQDGIKATWLGHSSFLLELPAEPGARRGLRFLMDPVFAKRMGPLVLLGPRRFTPTPCSLDDLPLVDAICISHDHYDHLDKRVVRALASDAASSAYRARRRAAGLRSPVHVFCALGNKTWFTQHGVPASQITEMDWWSEALLDLPGVGRARLACTPSQHGSHRVLLRTDRTLWCSFAITDLRTGLAVFFGGDTGYRAVSRADTRAGRLEADLPHCPAFADIGQRYGPFALALLPIGCYSPRTYQSAVHANPEDAVAMHFDLRSRLSVGMHYGTIRGGTSRFYEDVLEPPRRWQDAAVKQGLVWGDDVRLCHVGETVVAPQ